MPSAINYLGSMSGNSFNRKVAIVALIGTFATLQVNGFYGVKKLEVKN